MFPQRVIIVTKTRGFNNGKGCNSMTTVTGQCEDMILVPRKPTKEMIAAGALVIASIDNYSGLRDEDAVTVFLTMIQAAGASSVVPPSSSPSR
jgi:hypothetical protein